MRILILILFPFFLNAQDKSEFYHYVAGAAIAYGSGIVLNEIFELDYKVIPIAGAISFGASWGKEKYDECGRTGYNPNDLDKGIRGALTGMFFLIPHINVSIQRSNKEIEKLNRHKLLFPEY